MSHFSVLVIGGNVEEQLAPYHEFESTGDDNQYVKEIDQTEEALAQFKESTVTRYQNIFGNLFECFTEEGEYAEGWLREPTPEELEKHGKMFGSGSGDGIRWTSHDWKDGKGYRAKV